MFSKAESRRHQISDKRYDKLEPTLRAQLLKAHFAQRDAKRQVIVIVSGADGAGKGELVHRLNEWLDPRGVETHAFWDLTDEEREHPHLWRYWRAMPGAGRVGVFFGSWYTRSILGRVFKTRKRRVFEQDLERIADFERMLTDGGAILVKLWLHLGKDAQRTRLTELEEADRIGRDDWKHFKRYDRFRATSEYALERTHTEHAPWHVIDARDRRFREVTAGRILLAALKQSVKPVAPRLVERDYTPGPPLLATLDHTKKLTKAAYSRELRLLQGKLSRLTWEAHAAKRPAVLLFEGWDAAGKGSAIRRVTQGMDPRLYRVVGIAAPTDEERRQHYLWRFWRKFPRDGSMTIFDRSWYGRVLVERVEGFAPVADWDRAYGEILEMERDLVSHGVVFAKFWLDVTPEEQLKRFKERERVAHKQHKITDEDWRNREKYPAYLEAVEEMLARCSPTDAPWSVIATDDKRLARITILRTIVAKLDAALAESR